MSTRLDPCLRLDPHRRLVCAAALALNLACTAINSRPVSAQTAEPITAKSAEAVAALQRGDLEQAILLYNTVLDDQAISNDRRAILLVERGVAYMKRHNFKQALEDFNKAIALYPEYSAAYVNRGNLLLTAGQSHEALREAVNDFDRAIVLAPGLAAPYGNRGAAYLKLGQPQNAIGDFNRAIMLQPQNPAALNGRGQARLMLGQVGGAVRDFSRAVSMNGAFAQAYRNRATANSRRGRAIEVAEDLSRALAFDARKVDDYLARGEAYLAIGNANAALTDFTKVIELEPKSVAGHIGLGQAQALLTLTDESLASLSRAVELDPRSARAYAVRAWIYVRSQQPELGQKDVERAMRLEPVTADAYWADGELKEASGDRDGARDAYARALAVNLRHRETLAALNRLGLQPQTDESPLPAAGADGWSVAVVNGTEFYATHSQFPNARFSLEMMGEGQPKILGWERQNAPNSGYGLLRYAAGSVAGVPGAETVECTAIIDLKAMAIIDVPVEKFAGRTATYTWGRDRLQVTGADGLVETIALGDRPDRQEGAEADPALRRGDGAPGQPRTGVPSRDQAVRRAAGPRKPKTIFDLIFGN